MDQEIHDFLLKHLNSVQENDVAAYHDTTAAELTFPTFSFNVTAIPPLPAIPCWSAARCPTAGKSPRTTKAASWSGRAANGKWCTCTNRRPGPRLTCRRDERSFSRPPC